MLTTIHFIINPISGNGKNKLTQEGVVGFFSPEKFEVKIKKTLKPNHASSLTHESIKEGADVVVACGGDGTINEIASCLVGSRVKLGIVPMGSGNGLASTLKIPKQVKDALKVINKLKSTKIDVGYLNNHYFFSNTGIGFDAKVINYYAQTRKRRLTSYLRASALAFIHNNPSALVKINTPARSFNLRPFMVFASNTNEMGYGTSLTPNASTQDGMLDVVVVEPLNRLEIIYFSLLLLIKKPQSLKKAHYFLTENIEIRSLDKEGFLIQIDGESKQIETNLINIGAQRNALSVLVP